MSLPSSDVRGLEWALWLPVELVDPAVTTVNLSCCDHGVPNLLGVLTLQPRDQFC